MGFAAIILTLQLVLLISNPVITKQSYRTMQEIQIRTYLLKFLLTKFSQKKIAFIHGIKPVLNCLSIRSSKVVRSGFEILGARVRLHF